MEPEYEVPRPNADGKTTATSTTSDAILNSLHTQHIEEELLGQTEPMEAQDDQEAKLLELNRILEFTQKNDQHENLDLGPLRAIIHEESSSDKDLSQEQQILNKVNSQLDLLIRGRSIHAIAVLQNLADLCRNEQWRLPLAEAGILETATNAMNDEVSPSFSGAERLDIQIQALRLIGNMCADIDDNRERALQLSTLQVVMGKFQEHQLVGIGVPAVFNICNDFDPAKDRAVQEGLFQSCLNVLDSGILKSTPAFSSLCLLLDIVYDKVDAAAAPTDALKILLKVSLDGDLEVAERLSLLRLTNKLLTLESNQQDLIQSDRVELVLGSLFRTFSEATDPMDVVLSGAGHTISDDADEEQELANARITLVQILADISAQGEFAEKYGVFTDPSMLVWKLKYVMLSPFTPISQAACLMLGNLAHLDDICIRMVKDVNIHQAASAILKDAVDVRLIHAVLGLLRNLALPAENKDSLAMVGVIENLHKCWLVQVNPQIQLAAASLMRQMVNGSMANIQRLLLMSSPTADESGAMQTQLAVLISVYSKTDELAIKTEIARTVTAILRCVYGKEIAEETRNSVLADLYSHHANLDSPIIGMVMQTEYPVVRSEGWFALGLLSRDSQGRTLLARHIVQPAFLEILRATVSVAVTASNSNGTAAEPPQQSDSKTDTKDRENALLVIHEILQDPLLSLVEEQRHHLQQMLERQA